MYFTATSISFPVNLYVRNVLKMLILFMRRETAWLLEFRVDIKLVISPEYCVVEQEPLKYTLWK